jgi:hypothetical protein
MRKSLRKSLGGAAAALMLAMLASVSAQEAAPGSSEAKDAPAEHRVTPDDIDKRIEERAAEIQKIAPKGAARYVVYDIAWPATAEEYRALGRHAILFLSAVSQNADELPLKQVYTRQGGKSLPLKQLSSKRRDVPSGSLTHTMFGPYREDSFYLLPVGALMQEWKLLADFAKNRNEFSISLSQLNPPRFIQTDRTRNAGKVDPAALKVILEREFPGFEVMPK